MSLMIASVYFIFAQGASDERNSNRDICQYKFVKWYQATNAAKSIAKLFPYFGYKL